MTVTIKVEGTEELAKALENARRDLPRKTAKAINDTSRITRTAMTKGIQSHIEAKTGEINKILRVRKRAKAKLLNSLIQLEESRRLSLKAFKGTRQTKRGVSYMIDKRTGRKLAPGGFMGPRPGVKAPKLGGHAYKRVGKSRKPIVRLHGVSPWGIYTKNNMRPGTVFRAERELHKQIQRQIREAILRRQKLI